MGKIKNGLLSGKIGNLVFAGNTVRGLQKERTASSWSEDQKSQRGRVTAVAKLYRSLRTRVVAPIWKKNKIEGLTAYNQFVQSNIKAFNKRGELADPGKLCLSRGVLENPFEISVVTKGEKGIALKWQSDSLDSQERENDELLAVFFNGKNFSGVTELDSVRSNDSASVVYPEGFSRNDYMYVFFGSRKRDKFSDSIALKL